jgi:hypothetical protein
VRASLTRWRYTATSASGHEELRPFTWGRWNFDALRAHWPLVPGPKRPAFRRHLDEVATGLARSAYHRAVREDRRWGTRYLLALAGASRRPARVLPYLLALWTPARVRSGLGRLARRAPR